MTNGNSGGDARPGSDMLRGSAWMIGLRWAVRLIGVVSTVVLARVLSPDDFGVVAIAMIVVGMFEMLSDTGQGAAIIRHRTPTPKHYDTAWTIYVAVGLALGAAIYLIAPLTNIYFHDERAVLVMQCLSLRPVLSGLENIGLLDFKRNLQFDSVFSYTLYTKLISFVVTISLALLLHNYWALVAGILCGQVARTVLSFTMHPYRPRLSLAALSEIYSFSVWVFLRSIGTYLQTQVDAIAVGGANGAASMGRYTVAKDLGSSPTEEIVAPMATVLFPVMAKYQHDRVQLRDLYLRVLGWCWIVGLSTAVGVSLVAPDVVPLVLGPKWASIIPLLGWIAFEASVAALSLAAYTVLDVRGFPRLGARLQWLRVIILAVAIFPVAYWTRDLLNIVIIRLIVTLLLMPAILMVAGRSIGVGLRDHVRAMWRASAASAVMAGAVFSLNQMVDVIGPVRLGLDVIVGATVYAGVLILLWNVSGRPVSPEQDLLTLLSRGWEGLDAIRARAPKTVR
jgi:lipopolysaccharide exporter